MFTSLSNGMRESMTDVSQNPIALFIFGAITLLIIALILATMFPFWRRVLVAMRLLENDERPSSLLFWIISIVIIVKVVQTFVVQPFVVEGGSMLPTFHNKEFLLVDKVSYSFGKPKRGDVAIFKLYEGNNPYSGKHLIKRIIGLPGERVVIRDGKTYIFNDENPDGFVLDESFIVNKDASKRADVTLGEDQYFMMGDNRSQSYDSRDWGPLPEKDLRGQVLFRVYPFTDAEFEPGRYMYTK